jgi:hypothetical protein
MKYYQLHLFGIDMLGRKVSYYTPTVFKAKIDKTIINHSNLAKNRTTSM